MHASTALKKNVSIRDVAKAAQVSTAAVSKALNNKPDISSGLRKRIFAVCEKLGYRLNPSIQDLVRKGRNGHARNIAFVLAGINFSNPSYARLVDGISESSNKHHYHLTLVKLTGKEESIYDLPPALRDERIDGILISGIIEPNIVALMKSLNTQCVVVGNYSAALLGSLSSVQTNVAFSVFEALEQLVKQGKKRIAFTHVFPNFHFEHEVFSGYKQALAELGLPFDEKICYFGQRGFIEVLETIKMLLLKKKLPFDSILCHDYHNAYELSHLIIKEGYAMNRDMPITIATIKALEDYNLPVPTVYARLNLAKCMETALQLLIEQIEGRKISQTIMV